MSGSRHAPLVSAGAVLGLGLGGFLDGNMFWDGLFHVATWLVTVVGVALLWRAVKRDDVPRSTGTLLGAILLGAGLFNVVEGTIDHHLLGIHHVAGLGTWWVRRSIRASAEPGAR